MCVCVYVCVCVRCVCGDGYISAVESTEMRRVHVCPQSRRGVWRPWQVSTGSRASDCVTRRERRSERCALPRGNPGNRMRGWYASSYAPRLSHFVVRRFQSLSLSRALSTSTSACRVSCCVHSLLRSTAARTVPCGPCAIRAVPWHGASPPPRAPFCPRTRLHRRPYAPRQCHIVSAPSSHNQWTSARHE